MGNNDNRPMMRIGYDGKRAVCNNTGIGNYSRCLVEALSAAYPHYEYVLYSPKFRDNPALQPLLARDNVSLSVPTGMWRRFGSLWRSVGVTRSLADDGVSLYHGLSNELPLNIARSGVPSVVTVHDLIWRRVPGNYSAADRWLYDHKYGASARAATRVIAISECTKADIVNDFGISPDKVDVVYQGCNPLFLQPLDPARFDVVRERYGLPERYIVSVGTVELRKNQLQAVKALRGLPDDVRLVIVGRSHKGYGKEVDAFVSSHSLADRVMRLTGVPTADLPYLYAMARYTSYTSRYEGFGLPLIESLSVGTPAIAATGSCLEEAGGDGALYVHPDDVDGYIDAARMLIDDDSLHSRLITAGRAHIGKFSAANFARATMDTYLRALVSR